MVIDEKEKEEEKYQKEKANLDFAGLRPPKVETSQGVKEQESKLKPLVIKPSLFGTNLERFHYFCKDYPSRSLFIDFNFRYIISSALARRVWVGESKGNPIYANQFYFFVADPGLGKSLPATTTKKIINGLTETKLDKSSNKLVELKLINLGPDATSWEKMVARAKASVEISKDKTGRSYLHSSTTFCLADEVEMLFDMNAGKVVAFLNQGYDCDRFENDTYKHDVQIIKNICINFLGCTTPKVMQKLMRMGVLNNGYTARTLFLFADKKRKHPPLIRHSEEQLNEIEILKQHLRKLAKLPAQQVELSSDAKEWLDDWHEKNENPDRKIIRLNDSPLLKDYYARRKTHLIKHAINFAFSDSIPEYIDVPHLVDADGLLSSAEPDMHKALAGNSENPLSALADGIKIFLEKNGPTSRRRLMLNFFNESKDGVEGIVKVLDFLVNTHQCFPQTVDGQDGIRIRMIKEKGPIDETED
jgi:hypothetical protein